MVIESLPVMEESKGLFTLLAGAVDWLYQQ
jgi:hypothetical protein